LTSRFDRLDLSRWELPRGLVGELLTPALVVYLDVVRENLRRVIGYLDGDPDRWRAHVKTVKIPEVFSEIARAGVRAFKCATTREAERLLRTLDEESLRNGDVLVAYPLIGPSLVRLGRIAEDHPASRVSVLCEDAETLEAVPANVTVFADVNPGMNRTGVPLDRLADLLEIGRRAGKRFRGVHFYDGHLARGAPESRRSLASAGYDRLMDILAAFDRAGIPVGEVITSGTPTFRHAVAYRPLAGIAGTRHRVSPGTVTFHDFRYEQEIEEIDLLPGAVVVSRIVSRPAADIATCDAGSKAIAAEAGDPCAYVLGHPELRAMTPSEEHLPLRIREGPAPRRGALVYLVPRHVCPTVNLSETAILMDGGRLRGIVSVSARAHEHPRGDPRAAPG
jgi:D-serine deaminase-like pyridoxal phosphate-dependent protein